MNNISYVYVLRSIKDGKWYTGCTEDLQKRFNEHNKGKVLSTKGRGPFEIIYFECSLNSKDAFVVRSTLNQGWGNDI